MKYYPDHWVIIQLVNYVGDVHERVFADWRGSYTTGDSWKMSSGIEEISVQENSYDMLQTSGSTYVCSKSRYGLSYYGESVLDHYIEASQKTEGEYKVSIRRLSEEEAKHYINSKLK